MHEVTSLEAHALSCVMIVAQPNSFFERNGSLQIPRIQLLHLKTCLDQKVTTVRQQSTGSTLLVLTVTYCPAVQLL